MEKNGIKYYNVIILPTEKIQAASEITKIMNNFKPILCVMVHKHSPLGYSLINEIHWHSPAAKDSKS